MNSAAAARSIPDNRLVLAWIAAATAIFGVALYLAATGDDGATRDSIGPSTDSRSAVGYAGIADILEQIGTPVVRSRSRSRERLGDGGVLVVAEPRVTPQTEPVVRKLIDANTVLLVLPKWDGAPDPDHRGWIGRAAISAPFFAQSAFDLTNKMGQVVRGPPPRIWDRNLVGPTPAISGVFQFIRSKAVRPIVADGDEILVGEIRQKSGRRIWVLSDPDVIANGGLGKAGNAAFAVALIGKMRHGGGPVVFDEAIHGAAGQTPSLIDLLFHRPILPTTIAGLIAVGLLLWSAAPRFGAAEPSPAVLDSGKIALIANTAALLGRASHRRLMIQRFVEATLRDVGRRLRAPRGLSDAGLAQWLGRAGGARGVGADPVLMLETAAATGKAQPFALVGLARQITLWKREMTDGPAGNQRAYRRAARRGSQGDRRAG
jgi:hypothetical protein